MFAGVRRRPDYKLSRLKQILELRFEAGHSNDQGLKRRRGASERLTAESA
jgi:hypothetical protein